ncbi:hypothetical protein HDK77DRAFT_282484 [Phyllosticta capitalensis]
MVDVQHFATAQHPQWSLDKTYGQSRSSGSPASTPDLDDAERIRIAPSSTHQNSALQASDALLQERYLSSEEDLSPTDRDSTESFELDEDDVEIMEAEVVSPRLQAGNGIPSPCKVATAVSYVSAGRAKVVNLSETAAVREQTANCPSVANAVPILKSPVPRMSRMSMVNAGHTPPASADRPNFSWRQNMQDVKAERRRTAMPMSQRPPLPKSPLAQDGDVLKPIPSTGSLRTTKTARHFSMAMTSSFGQVVDRPRLMRSTTDITNPMLPESNPGWDIKTKENQRRMQRASIMDLRSRTTPSPSKGRRSTEGEVPFVRGEVENRARMTPTPSTLSRTSTREQDPASPALERPPTLSSFFRRPSSARSSYSQPPRSKRGSVLHIRQRSGSVHLPTFVAPSTTSLASTKSVKTPTFLDTDPFEKKDVSPKSNEGKPTHRRLRSISRTLTLAKMAVTPASKRERSKSKSKSQPAPDQDSAILSPISPMTEPAEIKHSLYSPSPLGPSMPPTPVTPSAYSVSTPASSVFGRRSSSRMSGPSPLESASEMAAQRRKSSNAGKPKLIPRGADEREPPFELPPFPDEPESTGISRKLKKRKSTLGFY